MHQYFATSAQESGPPTHCQEDGRDRGQVEHGAPGGGRDDHVDHQRCDDTDADDKLVDAAQRSPHLGGSNLHPKPATFMPHTRQL